MKLVLFAFTEFGYQCTKHLHDQGEHEILIITAPADNGEPINGWKSVVSYCKNNNVKFLYNQERKVTKDVIKKVISFSPDLVFSCNYPLIIPSRILYSAKYGGLNFHGGILPYYRGCLSGVWSILNGEKESGVTLHYMDENIDTGDTVIIRKVKILPSDSAFSLYEKVRKESFKLFKQILPQLPILPKYNQDNKKARYYNRDLPHKGQIDWNWSSDYICRFVRAMYYPPFDPAEGKIGNNSIYLKNCTQIKYSGTKNTNPGKVLKETSKNIVIKTGNGAVKSSRFFWLKFNENV